MAKITFQIEGLDNLKARLNTAIAQLPHNVGAALYQFGEQVMAVSKERVPVDTGRLMNSGYVSLPEQEGSSIVVTLGYGTDYALEVHENMNPNVHWTRPGSGPKYLEVPLKEAEAQMGVQVGDAVKETLAA